MPTPLESSRLVLRPICESDNPVLYKWRNEYDFLKMVASRRTVVSLEKFLQEQKKAFEHDRHLQFMICPRSTPANSVGTIYSFNLNLTDGHVFINLFVDELWRRRGYGPEAGILLTCYLFDFFPLHKIYFEAFGYNDPSLSMLRTAGFVEEGVFREHRFFNGERHDVVRFAAYGSKLDRIRHLAERFRNRKERL